MWDEALEHLAKYPTAVLTGIDPDGYPFSVRCKPEPDSSQQVLRLKLPDYVVLQNGPAGLLCHDHDELLWKPTNFNLRGTLEKSGDQWLFRPSQFIEGVASHTRAAIRLIRNGRRDAKHYLEKRGLSRPRIPWDKFKTLYESIHKK